MDAIERKFSVYGQTISALQWPGEVDRNDAEPILALHGWLDNAASFAPLSRFIQRPLLAMDFSGHGHSDHRPCGVVTHLVDHVRDVLAVVDQLGWTRFTLMGHSMGAGIACLFAAACPERVSRVVLIEGLGPPSTDGKDVASNLRKALDDSASLAGKRKPVYAHVEDAIEARTKGFGGLNHKASALLSDRGLMPVEGGWTWRADSRLRLTSFLRLTEEQVEGFVRAIKAPVCLIIGEQGMGGNGMFDHRLGWLSGATIIRLPGRHHLHMEEPQSVAASINTFLCETDDLLSRAGDD
ncbi:hydrolase [Alcanivorax sp. 97CO-5]|jgi:pimeloyl-ACP methyl ester carboxylesterase|uniref:alpha/beta fold hydrolase n=1 Tax=unclassified Alcanivorax TaxID=2638842 RepID=UPI0003E7E0FE|nr:MULTISPECIES: alpha/beta hydrolase [unclassified Alcanivorax]EUC70457.1 hydrolase [Alcanivorax sp. 97CO-5]PKG02119.1 alpha/beta hydrolase [Alcanivorax sp. 97CO-6]